MNKLCKQVRDQIAWKQVEDRMEIISKVFAIFSKVMVVKQIHQVVP